ncbi:probable membrane-associated kinase regulator 4 [Henckelia pumila]|uniref:probable membrane-associated kinase regulator 4 n=1 Tax=Henckelia pumila TaxID=405737 RepID=UPI003C6EA43C
MESVQDHEYINIEVDPLATILCHSNKEFEFQSFTGSSEANRAADQLFYMGKLLPLHLPPRLQMLEKILQTSSKPSREFDDESFSTPLFSASNTSTANTPFESCNVSPVESCQVSGELNPKEYFLEYSTSFEEKKYSWGKRLKLIKQSSSIGSKLKRAFIKSLFAKSGCSYEASAAADAKKPPPKSRDSEKASAKNVAPFGQIQAARCSNKKMMLSLSNRESNIVTQDCQAGHRRSFSGAFKRLSKSASSMSDYSSSRSAAVKNSCGTNLELENSIHAAIAHCKRSQNQPSSKIIAGESILCPMPASSQVVFDDKERTGRCRG